MKDLALDILLSQILHACKVHSKVDLTFFLMCYNFHIVAFTPFMKIHSQRDL